MKLPKYKRKEKFTLAWIFISCIDIEITDTTAKLTIRHLNADFIHRFLQLVKLGQLSNVYATNIRKWQLTDPKEMIFFLRQIAPYIRTQREKRISKLLVQFCEDPNKETATQIRRLHIKTPSYF